MKQQKTLLIIGAGFEQVPAIKMAKLMGHKVVVTDLNPQAAGVKFADDFGLVSTNDKQGNLIFAQQQKIDGVMTLGSELAVPVVAFVCEQLNLPGLSSETALKATNKNVMHEAFIAGGVPTPHSNKINQLSELQEFVESNGWPVVVKPSDSSGQRGIGIFHEGGDLAFALKDAVKYSSDGYAIVENYIDGPEINVTAAVQDGEIEFLSFSHRVTASSPHFGIAIEHRAPVAISSERLNQVKLAAIKAIKAIGLTNGIAYPQIISSVDRGAQVLEIAARIPGGYMREVALVLSGIDMIEVAIRQALNESLSLNEYAKSQPSEAVVVKFYTQLDLEEGVEKITEIAGFEEVITRPGVFLANCRLKALDEVPPLESSTARFGALIVRADSSEEVQTRLQKAMAAVEATSSEFKLNSSPVGEQPIGDNSTILPSFNCCSMAST